MKKQIDVCITFDVDEDHWSTHHNFEWSGVSEGIPLILKILNSLSNTQKIKSTWFVRCDLPLKIQFGSHSFLFKNFSSIWQNLIAEGHEIGWHGHIHRNHKGQWVQELDDTKVGQQISNSIESMINNFQRPLVTRLGGLFGSNKTMATLDQYKIIADSSALPGRILKNEKHSFDWGITPEIPYYPSVEKYNQSGDSSYGFLEIPLTTYKFMFSYDDQPYIRYIDLTYKEKIFQQLFDNFNENITSIITLSHPDRILNVKKSDVYGNSIQCYHNNLKSFIQFFKSKNIQLNFITMSELAKKTK